MSTINKCDLCLVEWDSQLQNHRRGPDCVAGIKGLIDDLYALQKRMELALSEHAQVEHEKEDATVNAFMDVRQVIEKLEERHEKLAKRVTVIEHPGLAKSPLGKKA